MGQWLYLVIIHASAQIAFADDVQRRCGPEAVLKE